MPNSDTLAPDGLRLFNKPDTQSNLATIRAVLETTRVIKHAMLLHLFKHPLHVYITSGKRCGYRSRIDFKENNLEPFLANNLVEILTSFLASFPLKRLASVAVRSVPSMEDADQYQYLRTGRVPSHLEFAAQLLY
jgi:hypothetical protein